MEIFFENFLKDDLFEIERRKYWEEGWRKRIIYISWLVDKGSPYRMISGKGSLCLSQK